MAIPASALTSARNWAAVGERGSLAGMRLTAWVYRFLGPRLAALLILPIVTYFFLTDPPGRRASRRYLDRLHAVPSGDRTLGHRPGVSDVFRHYREFAQTTLDRVGFWSGRAADFEIHFDGAQHFAPLIEAKRGAILLGAHLGSFDALRALADRWSITVNIVMSTRHAPRINRVLQELSPKTRARVIEVDPTSSRSVFELKACLERGEFVAVLGDRIGAAPRTRAIEVDFLGHRAPFPPGPFVLASLLDCPVLLMVGLRIRSGAYRIIAEPLAERITLPRGERVARLHELVQAYAKRLEAYCLMTPFQWFNFYDFWGDEASA
jgi:predicted LPLAT superfamily acyltransferase